MWDINDFSRIEMQRDMAHERLTAAAEQARVDRMLKEARAAAASEARDAKGARNTARESVLVSVTRLVRSLAALL